MTESRVVCVRMQRKVGLLPPAPSISELSVSSMRSTSSGDACIAAADFLLVPVKASPLDVDRMLDTLNSLIDGAGGKRPTFRCILTQTTRDSVIAKQVRAELIEAGFPVLENEMVNRVAYAEAGLWGATPSLISWKGPAAREIAAIAAEVDNLVGIKKAA